MSGTETGYGATGQRGVCIDPYGLDPEPGIALRPRYAPPTPYPGLTWDGLGTGVLRLRMVLPGRRPYQAEHARRRHRYQPPYRPTHSLCDVRY
eukprot:2534851-Rhodomonas_salina.1